MIRRRPRSEALRQSMPAVVEPGSLYLPRSRVGAVGSPAGVGCCAEVREG